MEKKSRIKFNPVTKEIEVEGSEKFVKTYFDKLQGMISGVTVRITKRQKVGKVHHEKKRVSNISVVLGFIQDNTEGISTAALKQKTGLSKLQIWSIVNSAAKEGKIKKLKRGLYGPA